MAEAETKKAYAEWSGDDPRVKEWIRQGFLQREWAHLDDIWNWQDIWEHLDSNFNHYMLYYAYIDATYEFLKEAYYDPMTVNVWVHWILNYLF